VVSVDTRHDKKGGRTKKAGAVWPYLRRRL
jgi:hypothetical protein